MKAMMFDRFGGPEVLYYGDAPDPVAGPGEVVVDIHAVSVNPADGKTRAGGYAKELRFPYIAGRDFSGVVSTVGDGVTDLAPGDAVYGVLEAGRDGTYAEQVNVKAELVAKKPDSLSHVEAAALGVAAITALIGLEDTAELRKGQKVLIQGGAGGVGGLAVQLAHAIGAHVIATASPRNHDYLRDLGADEVIDYNTQDFTKVVADCDLVFDTVGGEVQARSFEVLKPGGFLMYIAPPPPNFKPPRDDVKYGRPNVQRHRSYMERISAHVASGALRVPEIETMKLADAGKAQEKSETGHVRGKIVLTVR
jgi:NADPH:quinone reductase-like Zn-dependent oxidoreductase